MVATATYYITIVTEKTGVISVTMAVFQQISLFSAIVTEKQADFLKNGYCHRKIDRFLCDDG